jgi:hypothetical protein
MKKTVIFNLLLSTLLLGAWAAPTLAASSYEDEDEVFGYDAIVNELNREVDHPARLRAKAVHAANDPLENVMFHFGVGGTTMMESLNFADGSQMFVGLKGMQFTAGIDLFSPYWMAEGSLRNFGQGADQPTHVSVQEFELKMVFHERFYKQFAFHVGGGLSARYLSIENQSTNSQNKGQTNSSDYTTPTSVASGGFSYFFTDRFSVGFEAAARTALISETLDRNSYDATLRLDLQL